MEPWQIITLIILVVVAAGVAYAVFRRKRPAEPPDTAKIRRRKAEAADKEETTKKVRKEELERVEKKKKKKRFVEVKKVEEVVAEEEIEEVAEVMAEKEVAAEEEEKRKEAERARAERARKEKEEREKRAAERIIPIRKGLEKTRGGFIYKLKKLVKRKKEISPELLGEIEELFITSDIGVKTTEKFLEFIKENLSKKELLDQKQVWSFIREEAKRILSLEYTPPQVGSGDVYTIMVVGVNGVGKTTTIGKLASRFQQEGKKVILAAADTFRAAAVSQLEVWGRRVNCDVVKGKEGADPSSVAFDAIEKARNDKAHVVITDTAGRLHTKVPLMDELKKLKRVMAKAQPNAPHEVLLVLDATTGQNGVAQAKSFLESLDITGIVLTKLDGTAKGGVILSICNEMNIPVRHIGIGEGVEDLKDFNSDEFIAALFDEVAEKEIAA